MNFEFVNNWLETFGSQHSILESRFPSPLHRDREPVVLMDRRCVHIHETLDGHKYLCARPAEEGAWCIVHARNDSSFWNAPTEKPSQLKKDTVAAFVDGVWIDVNKMIRLDNHEKVDFVDSILIW